MNWTMVNVYQTSLGDSHPIGSDSLMRPRLRGCIGSQIQCLRVSLCHKVPAVVSTVGTRNERWHATLAVQRNTKRCCCGGESWTTVCSPLPSPPKLPRLSFYLALSVGSLLWPLGCILVALMMFLYNRCSVCYLPFWLLFSTSSLSQLLLCAAAAARACVILEVVVVAVVVVLIAILVCALDRHQCLLCAQVGSARAPRRESGTGRCENRDWQTWREMWAGIQSLEWKG